MKHFVWSKDQTLLLLIKEKKTLKLHPIFSDVTVFFCYRNAISGKQNLERLAIRSHRPMTLKQETVLELSTQLTIEILKRKKTKKESKIRRIISRKNLLSSYTGFT